MFSLSGKFVLSHKLNNFTQIKFLKIVLQITCKSRFHYTLEYHCGIHFIDNIGGVIDVIENSRGKFSEIVSSFFQGYFFFYSSKNTSTREEFRSKKCYGNVKN